MAHRCKSCKKVSRGKKKPMITTHKRHCCPGCGGTDFEIIDDAIDMVYDFEELIFDFIDTSKPEEGFGEIPDNYSNQECCEDQGSDDSDDSD